MLSIDNTVMYSYGYEPCPATCTVFPKEYALHAYNVNPYPAERYKTLWPCKRVCLPSSTTDLEEVATGDILKLYHDAE